MTRRQFIDQIAFGYAAWEADMHAEGKFNLAPLDTAYAVNAGRGMVERGEYRTQTDRAQIDPMWIDWSRVANEAARALPRMRRLIAEFGESPDTEQPATGIAGC